MLYMRDLPLTEAVYTFVAADTGQPTHIAASTLRMILEGLGWEITDCIIAGSLASALARGELGVEPAHALSLPESALEAPGIVCEWQDTHVIADGAHRLWRRWKRGDMAFPAYLVPEPAWRPFVICDMPGDGKFWDHFNRNAQVRL